MCNQGSILAGQNACLIGLSGSPGAIQGWGARRVSSGPLGAYARWCTHCPKTTRELGSYLDQHDSRPQDWHDPGWDENDNVVPVTVIQAGPCAVSQVKTQATDGYDAVQIGFGDIKAKNVNKPMAGHFAKAGVEPVRFLREVRVENGEEHKVGEVVTVADFADVEKVDVIGTSKGKGFQGRIKRWVSAAVL